MRVADLSIADQVFLQVEVDQELMELLTELLHQDQGQEPMEL